MGRRDAGPADAADAADAAHRVLGQVLRKPDPDVWAWSCVTWSPGTSSSFSLITLHQAGARSCAAAKGFPFERRWGRWAAVGHQPTVVTGSLPASHLRMLSPYMDLIHARLMAARQDFEAWQAKHGAR